MKRKGQRHDSVLQAAMSYSVDDFVFFPLKWRVAFLTRVWNNNLFLLSERVGFHLAAESKPLWRMLLLPPPLLMGNNILNAPDTANAIYDVLKMNKPNSWCNKWNTVGWNNWKKSLSHWIMMQDAFLLPAKMKPNIVDMSAITVGAWAPVMLCWSLMKLAETWVGRAYLQLWLFKDSMIKKTKKTFTQNVWYNTFYHCFLTIVY